jgi:hypothetical protein
MKTVESGYVHQVVPQTLFEWCRYQNTSTTQ